MNLMLIIIYVILEGLLITVISNFLPNILFVGTIVSGIIFLLNLLISKKKI